MTTEQARQLIALMKSKGIQVAQGLSDKEIQDVQVKFDFSFPPDLELILQQGLPKGDQFPDWRRALGDAGYANEIIEWFDQPVKGILFDIESNGYWNESWGPKTNIMVDDIELARGYIGDCPKLIPLYSHRYIPSKPNEAGNPVYSVHQTDIIYYGFDLAMYLENEFKFQLPESFTRLKEPKKTIAFWSEIAE